MKNKGIFWFFIFSTILLLTQMGSFYDFGVQALIFGLPSWLFYFAIVHLLFIICLHFYSNNFIKKEEE